MRRRAAPGVVAIAVVAGLALAGCGSKKAASGTATTTSTSTAPVESTSTTVGLDQVPPVITVEYAQRVMNALDKLEGDLTRVLVANKVPNQQFHDMLTALYDEPAFSQAEASFGRDAAAGNDVYVAQPGDPTTVVKTVLDFAPGCLAINVERSLNAQLRSPQPAETLRSVLFLRPKKAERDTHGLNPTAWAITADGQPQAGVDLEHVCH